MDKKEHLLNESDKFQPENDTQQNKDSVKYMMQEYSQEIFTNNQIFEEKNDQKKNNLKKNSINKKGSLPKLKTTKKKQSLNIIKEFPNKSKEIHPPNYFKTVEKILIDAKPKKKNTLPNIGHKRFLDSQSVSMKSQSAQMRTPNKNKLNKGVRQDWFLQYNKPSTSELAKINEVNFYQSQLELSCIEDSIPARSTLDLNVSLEYFIDYDFLIEMESNISFKYVALRVMFISTSLIWLGYYWTLYNE